MFFGNYQPESSFSAMAVPGKYQKVTAGYLKVSMIKNALVVIGVQQSRSFSEALSCHKALHLDAVGALRV